MSNLRRRHRDRGRRRAGQGEEAGIADRAGAGEGHPCGVRGRREAGDHRPAVPGFPRAGRSNHREAEAKQGLTGVDGRAPAGKGRVRGAASGAHRRGRRCKAAAAVGHCTGSGGLPPCPGRGAALQRAVARSCYSRAGPQLCNSTIRLDGWTALRSPSASLGCVVWPSAGLLVTVSPDCGRPSPTSASRAGAPTDRGSCAAHARETGASVSEAPWLRSGGCAPA